MIHYVTAKEQLELKPMLIHSLVSAYSNPWGILLFHPNFIFS